MQHNHKPLHEQVVLITGASSGIGRQSAIRFARAGASVVLVARNTEALNDVVSEIEKLGGEAIAATADVADFEQLKAAAAAGVTRFGRIDTWVNNAGVGMYTKILDTDVGDDRRLFDTNFWGVVNGCRIAIPLLKSAGGGALINLGSEVSDVSVPVQGMYSTSKHAVLGFTDALREEIMHDELPISVTIIKPAAINTPFPRHAKNNMNRDATLPPPVYAVDIVADQILHAAVNGNRELYAGGGAWLMARLSQHFPSLSDKYLAATGEDSQLADRPADHSYEGLHESRSGFHRAQGDLERDHHVQKISLHGIVSRNPLTTLCAAAIGAAAIGLIAHSKLED